MYLIMNELKQNLNGLGCIKIGETATSIVLKVSSYVLVDGMNMFLVLC